MAGEDHRVLPAIGDPSSWTCPTPWRESQRVVLGHGGGGILSGELIEDVIAPALGAPRSELRDSALLACPPGGHLAFSTDAYVVSPLFFPGGCIGDLAVNGTVNDLAMSGAQPLALSVSLILEEGLALAELAAIAEAMGAAARAAGVPIITGDTKVVGAGHADGMFITTAGIGVVPAGIDIGPTRAHTGDVVLISGPIGEHGVAILSQREGIEFGTTVRTDSAALNGLVGGLIAAGVDLHVLRDPTRGGVAGSLSEIAGDSRVGIELDETAIPVPGPVAAACGFLGLDPLHVANEGKLIAIVPAADAQAALATMRRHARGVGAAIVGSVSAEHPGVVVGRTPLGATRVIERPMGEQLPRIC